MNEKDIQIVQKDTPPNPTKSQVYAATIKQHRSSNLELFRIICMLMIIAHHFVVNSGLTEEGGPITTDPSTVNSVFLYLFGAWGKTGINCFMMITGFFMCQSKISFRKFMKLILWVYFYKILIFSFFFAAGYETITTKRVIELVMPFWKLGSNFIGCFLVFYLTIPYWNILIKNMSERQHLLLMGLLLFCYTILGSIPSFTLTFNYISWFSVIYLIASYIRLYPHPIFQRKLLWGWLSVIILLLAIISILKMHFFFMIDSNKIFALAVSVTLFLWFKNLDIRYSKVINAFGASAFGVLLIHANSDSMRIWIWKEVVDCVGHYSLPLECLVLYGVGVVLAIFMICCLIDQLRILTIEKCFFIWYDKNWATKVDNLICRLTTSKQ